MHAEERVKDAKKYKNYINFILCASGRYNEQINEQTERVLLC